MDRIQRRMRGNMCQRKPLHTHVLPNVTYLNYKRRNLHFIEQE